LDTPSYYTVYVRKLLALTSAMIVKHRTKECKRKNFNAVIICKL